MDLGSTIVGTIFLVICMVPFVITYYNRVKKENKMMQSLNKIALEHNCNISQHEFCGDFAIGLDENLKCVFFFKQNKEEAITQFVELSETQTCLTKKNTRSSHGKNGNAEVIESIELCYVPTDKHKPKTKFELYNEEISPLSGELQLADKWSKKIGDLLKK